VTISKLRFNGTYRSSLQLDRLDRVVYWHYFLFYKDGSFKFITHEGPSKEAVERAKQDICITKGAYKIKEEKIRIDLEDEYGGLVFEGALRDDAIYLKVDDGIGYLDFSDTYRFISNDEI